MNKHVILLLTTLLMVFISCNNDDKQKDLTDESLLKLISFKGERSSEKNQVNLLEENSAIDCGIHFLTIRLGRKSRGCRGFGICKACIGKCEDEQNRDEIEREVEIPYIEENGKLLINLELASAPSIDLSQYALEVEESLSLEVDDEMKIIDSGSYQFNQNLGEYGGYQINAN